MGRFFGGVLLPLLLLTGTLCFYLFNVFCSYCFFKFVHLQTLLVFIGVLKDVVIDRRRTPKYMRNC